MAKVIVSLEPGLFFAGIDRPWYVSRAAVRSELLKRFGFSSVRIYPRATKLPVDPHVDPRYGADWDEWLRAEYSGAPVKKETERVWAWLVKVPRAVAEKNAALATPEAEPPDERSSAAVALVALPVAAAWLFWRRSRR